MGCYPIFIFSQKNGERNEYLVQFLIFTNSDSIRYMTGNQIRNQDLGVSNGKKSQVMVSYLAVVPVSINSLTYIERESLFFGQRFLMYPAF